MGVYISLEYSSKSPLADAEGNALLGLQVKVDMSE